MQPLCTAGQNKLPKNQQRRQDSKAGLKHALRATESREPPARPVLIILPDVGDKSMVRSELMWINCASPQIEQSQPSRHQACEAKQGEATNTTNYANRPRTMS